MSSSPTPSHSSFSLFGSISKTYSSLIDSGAPVPSLETSSPPSSVPSEEPSEEPESSPLSSGVAYLQSTAQF